MKNSTLIFVKNNKRLLFILNTLFAFFGALIYLNTQKNIILLQLFPWISSILVIIDIWIIFCLFTGNITEILNLTYKRLIEDIILVFVIFYNTLHVLLSIFYSYVTQNLWYFFYGIYHLIFALALYNIFSNYKTSKKKDSLHILRHTSYFILSASVTFVIILTFVLRESERISLNNHIIIYSVSVITLVNLILSVIFIIKLKNKKSTIFISHKYINLAAAIFSLFFVQTIYLNEFCEHLAVDKMRIITLIIGVPCFLILLLIGLRLFYKSNNIKTNLS